MRILLFLLCIGFAIPAFAQDLPPMAGRGRGMIEGLPVPLMARYPTGTAAFLIAELNLKEPQQKEALAAYLDTLELPPSPQQKREMRKTLQTADLPQKMAYRVEMTKKYLARMQKRQTTIKELYQTLDKDQQQKADSLLGW